MSRSVLEAAAEWVRSSGLAGDHLDVAFHAGEPVLAGRAWFEQAFDVLQQVLGSTTRLRFFIQTNGTLIDAEWAALFKQHALSVSVSIDGPEWLHDAHRGTWSGRPSHHRTVEGISALKRANIPVSFLCVITERTLHHPEEIFDYFASLGPASVAFNFEEIEGPHATSTLEVPDAYRQIYEFFDRLWKRAEAAGFPFRIREISHLGDTIAACLMGNEITSEVNQPFSILSVDVDGKYSTFSPELLDLKHDGFGDFVLGSVMTGNFVECLSSTKYKQLKADIEVGVQKCRTECSYFRFCGGGSPVNKLSELGTFRGTETMYCRHSVKALMDLAIARTTSALDVGE